MEQDFEEFARARTPELYRVAYLLCGESYAAEDLVQDTLARLFSRWRLVTAADNPAAYARTVLVRTFVSGRRRRSSSEIATGTLAERVDTGPDLDLRRTLVAALQALGPVDRAVLVMRYLLDQDVATVAAQLGLTSYAVRSRATRSLATVRACLGDDVLTIDRST